MQTLKVLNTIKTPAYVLEAGLLRQNLEKLSYVREKSGVKIMLALKAFAFTNAMDMVAQYLDGISASGLWEAKLGTKYVKKEVHTYSPAFKEEDFEEIATLSSHIVFNSLSQFEKFKNKGQKHNSFGLRCNVQMSSASNELYNPCGRFSRLGVKAAQLEGVDLTGLQGLHFHALCEQGVEEFEPILKEFEKNFSKYFKGLKWVNFGGGQLITKKGYDIEKLIRLCKDFKAKYGLEVILEPGEAVAWQTGTLVASVLDIIENEKKIAILDTSSEAHMPDTIIMPYTSKLADARVVASKDALKMGLEEKGEFNYILAGNTCLAGDVMGEYAFKHELQIGQKLAFLDQIHYSIVKNTTFNGIALPSLVFLKENGELVCKDFTYDEYERRN